MLPLTIEHQRNGAGAEKKYSGTRNGMLLPLTANLDYAFVRMVMVEQENDEKRYSILGGKLCVLEYAEDYCS